MKTMDSREAQEIFTVKLPACTRDTRCSLCRGDDPQGHIFESCMHPDMSKQYIARHDRAMRSDIQGFQQTAQDSFTVWPMVVAQSCRLRIAEKGDFSFTSRQSAERTLLKAFTKEQCASDSQIADVSKIERLKYMGVHSKRVPALILLDRCLQARSLKRGTEGDGGEQTL